MGRSADRSRRDRIDPLWEYPCFKDDPADKSDEDKDRDNGEEALSVHRPITGRLTRGSRALLTLTRRRMRVRS